MVALVLFVATVFVGITNNATAKGNDICDLQFIADTPQKVATLSDGYNCPDTQFIVPSGTTIPVLVNEFHIIAETITLRGVVTIYNPTVKVIALRARNNLDIGGARITAHRYIHLKSDMGDILTLNPWLYAENVTAWAMRSARWHAPLVTASNNFVSRAWLHTTVDTYAGPNLHLNPIFKTKNFTMTTEVDLGMKGALISATNRAFIWGKTWMARVHNSIVNGRVVVINGGMEVSTAGSTINGATVDLVVPGMCTMHPLFFGIPFCVDAHNAKITGGRVRIRTPHQQGSVMLCGAAITDKLAGKNPMINNKDHLLDYGIEVKHTGSQCNPFGLPPAVIN